MIHEPFGWIQGRPLDEGGLADVNSNVKVCIAYNICV